MKVKMFKDLTTQHKGIAMDEAIKWALAQLEQQRVETRIMLPPEVKLMGPREWVEYVRSMPLPFFKPEWYKLKRRKRWLR